MPIGHAGVMLGACLGAGEDRPLHRRPLHDVLKEREQAVVIALRNRVDFVIVAAGAVDRQPQEGLAGGGHDVVKPVVAELFPVGRFVIPHTEPVVAGGDQSVA